MDNTIQGLRTNGPAIIGVGITFLVLAVLTGCMRLVSKRLAKASYGWDDFLSLAALAVYFVTVVLVIRSDIIGKLSTSEDDAAQQTYSLYVFIYSIFYYTIIALCIASVLLLYRRVFPIRFMRWATLVLLIIDVCWYIPCLIISIGKPTIPPFPGDPDQASWNVTYTSFWLATGIIEQVIIIVAIFLPIREIYHLQLGVWRRVLLTCIFAISYLCVITGIVRLALLYRPAEPQIDLSIGDVWISVHCGTAVMSINLPCCWPLVSHRTELLSLLTRRSGSSGSDKVRSKTSQVAEQMSVGKKVSSSSLIDDPARVASMLDPRHTDLRSQARRVASNERNNSAFRHAREIETGEAIGVTRTIQVHDYIEDSNSFSDR